MTDSLYLKCFYISFCITIAYLHFSTDQEIIVKKYK